MPVRATKRGDERTPLPGEWDVLVCGASFAGLAVAREIARSHDARARVLVLDRYEMGERQTSACAAPTPWLVNLGLEASIRQTFDSILVRTPRVSARWHMDYTWATFDYPELCRALWAQSDATFETATVLGRTGRTVHTDRGDVTAPLIVDALGWRRILSDRPAIQSPGAALSRGLEVHPGGDGSELEVIIDPSYVSAGYSWSFPAGDEVRVGVASFDRRAPLKEPTLRLAADVGRPPEGFQGNWLPHWMRDATEDGVFFAGDSAGHCLPLPGEGIRTALYFGIACGRELRAVVEGCQDIGTAMLRYSWFCEEHRPTFRWLLRGQRVVRRLHGPVMDGAVRLSGRDRIGPRFFGRYLRIAPPGFALDPFEALAQGRAGLVQDAPGDAAARQPAPEAVHGPLTAA
jgi:flavin-dependent dehydrogenase